MHTTCKVKVRKPFLNQSIYNAGDNAHITEDTVMRRLLSMACLLTALGCGVPSTGLAYMGFGVGVDSCHTFLDAYSARQAIGYIHWLSGYLTAINATLHDTHDITGETMDTSPLVVWLREYCRLNPTKAFADGAGALIVSLYPTRTTHEPAVIVPPSLTTSPPRARVPKNTWDAASPPSVLTASPGSTPFPTSPRRDLIRQVQERLQAVGFSSGAIDGALGPQTRNALRWFQNTNDLSATGELDEKTLDALGVR